MKVVKVNGGKLTLGDAFKRRVCDCFDILFYGLPAIICITKTEKHQRIGDLFAGTVVVKRSDITETEIVF
ncbi:RDD family protein [Mucilaginibacter sp. OAE612]|uniref:RDD family protein n=1 Tax=Mucilaginibacter sp. OAE612 TaxID=3156444 RepID=UPI0035A07A81